MHKMTGLGGNFVWTLTYSYKPHCDRMNADLDILLPNVQSPVESVFSGRGAQTNDMSWRRKNVSFIQSLFSFFFFLVFVCIFKSCVSAMIASHVVPCVGKDKLPSKDFSWASFKTSFPSHHVLILLSLLCLSAFYCLPHLRIIVQCLPSSFFLFSEGFQIWTTFRKSAFSKFSFSCLCKWYRWQFSRYQRWRLSCTVVLSNSLKR